MKLLFILGYEIFLQGASRYGKSGHEVDRLVVPSGLKNVFTAFLAREENRQTLIQAGFAKMCQVRRSPRKKNRIRLALPNLIVDFLQFLRALQFPFPVRTSLSFAVFSISPLSGQR